MLLTELIKKYPQQYIAVAHTQKTLDNIIQEATLIKVYPTLEDAKNSKEQIQAYMKRYSDFDIVYGDYEDYVATRRRDVKIALTEEKLSQADIDQLIAALQ